MARKLCVCTAVVALGLAAPASAQSPLDEYQQNGHITACRYSPGQLEGSVPNDVAQYAPEYASQLQAAARERASGCAASAAAAGGSAGRGAAPGGTPGTGGGSNSEASGAGASTAAVATARTQGTQKRARTRRRALARARARLAAAQLAPADIAADARVPDRALLAAALPILLLLAIVWSVRGHDALGRRRGAGVEPARTRSGAIMLPPPATLEPDGRPNGHGNGHGSPAGATAESPTEEIDAIVPPPVGTGEKPEPGTAAAASTATRIRRALRRGTARSG